ncbi:MAG: histidine phosphatase family protein [Planctomycetota bacterium]
MDLYVVRHAVAVDGASFAGSDADRPLTPEGREKFAVAAKALARMDVRPGRLWTSPLVRARQTAEILARALDDARVEETDVLACGARAKRVLELAASAGDGPAIVVGHEPDLGELVAEAIGASVPLPLQKGAIVGVRFDDEVRSGRARLAFWLTTGAARRLLGRKK